MTATRSIAKNTDQAAALDETTTQDGFHNHAFEALQFKASGHRSGLDALLLAASLSGGITGTLADLGAGTGVAGLAALNLNAQLELVEVEKNPRLVKLARDTLLLPANAALRKRAKILAADVSLTGPEREGCGLETNSVDHVIMNPPYNREHQRRSPDHLKVEAHVMGEGGLDSWLRTAAAITRPGGTLALIYRTQDLGTVLACCQSRFGGLEILPVHARSCDAAMRMIIRGTRGSRAPLTIAPGFVVHKADGTFTPLAKVIFEGQARLEFAGR